MYTIQLQDYTYCVQSWWDNCRRTIELLVGIAVSKWAQEHFARHCDGMYTNDDGECSIYSLVIYLNDDFEGPKHSKIQRPPICVLAEKHEKHTCLFGLFGIELEAPQKLTKF